jgi:hypothetical protein
LVELVVDAVLTGARFGTDAAAASDVGCCCCCFDCLTRNRESIQHNKRKNLELVVDGDVAIGTQQHDTAAGRCELRCERTVATSLAHDRAVLHRRYAGCNPRAIFSRSQQQTMKKSTSVDCDAVRASSHAMRPLRASANSDLLVAGQTNRQSV